MKRIRADFKLRVMLLVLVVILAVLSYRLVRAEATREWKSYQGDFNRIYAASLTSRIEEADSGTPSSEVETWRQTLATLAATRPAIKQVFLPEANVRELCTTCHLGLDNPLMRDAPEPFAAHPGALIEQHDLNTFGCTLCHHGMGVGTTVEGAHGTEANWSEPLIPTKYIQSTCAGCHDTPFMLDGAEKLEQGRETFSNMGCYGCHAAEGFEDRPKVAAPLDAIATKLSNPSWMHAWLQQPSRLRAQTRMPNFKLTGKEAGDITAYLFSIGPDMPQAVNVLEGASAENGASLFVERGCRGCHSVRKDEPGASPRVPNLAGVGLKLRPEWIMAWLEDPKSYNPESRMPKLVLTVEERRDLTAYLMTMQANEDLVKPQHHFQVSAFDPENGKALVQLYGCHGCHTIEDLGALPAPGVGVSEMARKTLDELAFGGSKIPRTKWDWIRTKIESPRAYQTEDMPLRMPVFALEDGEIEALTTYYLNNARYDLPNRFLKPAAPRVRALEAGDWLVTAYNCHGCHMLREDEEAVIAGHLDLKSLVPPRLVGEGEKVQPQWLFQFLSKPSVLRPWLKSRMPDFGLSHDDAETLVNYFSELSAGSGIAFPYILVPTKEELLQEEIEMGAYRVRTDKCVQCHPIGLGAELPEDAKLEDLSIDLMLAKSRLRFDWIKKFLRNPDRYAGAGTKMPFVFYDPDGNAKVPDPEMWIDLTAKYLMVMQDVPEQSQEPLEDIRPGSEVDWTTFDE